MNARHLGIPFLLMLFFSAGVQAQPGQALTVSIFGPETFTRSTSAPQIEIQTFTVPDIVYPPYKLQVVSGTSLGTLRVASAQITLNGSPVFVTSDFNRGVSKLERVVDFSRQNKLEVILAGQPGSYLTITATGAVTEADLGFEIPPDPGGTGRDTVAGIDSDKDGVRDDVQRYIVSKYFFKSASTFLALKQAAKRFQSILLSSEDAETTVDNINKYFNTLECLNYIKPADWYVVKDDLRSAMLNTEARSQSWMRADKHYAGQSFRFKRLADLSSECQFDSLISGTK